MEKTSLTAALAEADNDLLLALRMPRLVLMAALDSANVGFIHFDCTVQHCFFRRSHCRPNTVAQIPCRLVGTFVEAPNRSLELRGTHALLSFTDQQDGKEPDRQRQVGIVKDRATHHRKLVLASDALKPGVILHPRHAAVFAAGAGNTFRPTEPFKQFPALIIGRKQRIDFRERHGYTS